MKWPQKRRPIPKSQVPFFNFLYLNATGKGGPDSTIVWNSEVPWNRLNQFVQQQNSGAGVMISPTALLVQAVGQSLARHPEMNRRVVGRRVFQFEHSHVCIATRVPNGNEVNVIMVPDVDDKYVGQVANFLWKKQLTFHRNDSPYIRDRERLKKTPGWVLRMLTTSTRFIDRFVPLPALGRIDRLRDSAVLVNDFSNVRFPVMRGYKPSRQPDESKPLNITLGRPEERVVFDQGRPVSKKFAPICVRADHRICDGFQLGQFVQSLIRILADPQGMQDVVTSLNASNQKLAA